MSRDLETHPTTRAAQFVEVRETVREVVVPAYTPAAAHQKPPLFARMTDTELLSYGVPPEWLPDVRRADEDSVLVLAERLPAEAAEALLELATGGRPRVPQPAAAVASPFEHPDAQRRFRVVSSVEELQRALDAPWEKWTVFLHPEQQQWVQREYSGPARVAGSAGTGKTIVALHRAVHLARTNPEARVLLATFSEPLAHALRSKLRHLVGNEPRVGERIEVYALDALALRLYQAQFGLLRLATDADIQTLLQEASAAVGDHPFRLRFLKAEWDQIVEAWQLDTWEAYRTVPRLGRQTRLPEKQRAVLWAIFKRVREALHQRGLMTQADVFRALSTALTTGKRPAFDFAVVDEAQDISCPMSSPKLQPAVPIAIAKLHYPESLASIPFRRGCWMARRRRVSLVDRRARIGHLKDRPGVGCGSQRCAR